MRRPCATKSLQQRIVLSGARTNQVHLRRPHRRRMDPPARRIVPALLPPLPGEAFFSPHYFFSPGAEESLAPEPRSVYLNSEYTVPFLRETPRSPMRGNFSCNTSLTSLATLKRRAASYVFKTASPPNTKPKTKLF